MSVRSQRSSLANKSTKICWYLNWQDVLFGMLVTDWEISPGEITLDTDSNTCWLDIQILCNHYKSTTYFPMPPIFNGLFRHKDMSAYKIKLDYVHIIIIRTQVAIDDLAVVHLASHRPNLLELCLLALHTFLQPLQLLRLWNGLLLAPLLLLQVAQTLLLQRIKCNKI